MWMFTSASVIRCFTTSLIGVFSKCSETSRVRLFSIRSSCSLRVRTSVRYRPFRLAVRSFHFFASGYSISPSNGISASSTLVSTSHAPFSRRSRMSLLIWFRRANSDLNTITSATGFSGASCLACLAITSASAYRFWSISSLNFSTFSANSCSIRSFVFCSTLIVLITSSFRFCSASFGPSTFSCASTCSRVRVIDRTSGASAC